MAKQTEAATGTEQAYRFGRSRHGTKVHLWGGGQRLVSVFGRETGSRWGEWQHEALCGCLITLVDRESVQLAEVCGKCQVREGARTRRMPDEVFDALAGGDLVERQRTGRAHLLVRRDGDLVIGCTSQRLAEFRSWYREVDAEHMFGLCGNCRRMLPRVMPADAVARIGDVVKIPPILPKGEAEIIRSACYEGAVRGGRHLVRSGNRWWRVASRDIEPANEGLARAIGTADPDTLRLSRR